MDLWLRSIDESVNAIRGDDHQRRCHSKLTEGRCVPLNESESLKSILASIFMLAIRNISSQNEMMKSWIAYQILLMSG